MSTMTEEIGEGNSDGLGNPLADTFARYRSILRAFLESLVAGLICGLIDVNSAGSAFWSLAAYFISGVFLGFRHAGRSWACWSPLGLSLYVVHVAAILWGYKQPYVEVDLPAATATFWIIVPVGIAIMLGVAIRVACSALGWLRRDDGRPIHFFSVNSTVAVICTFAALVVLSWIDSPNETLYAPSYNEAKFHRTVLG